MRILIVDDDLPSRTLLARALEEWGYEILQAADGQEAWETLEAEPGVQLLITDWMMPRIDGLELCRRLKARDEAPYLYIIMLTVRGERDDVVEGLEAGADDFLTKPVDRLELKSRLTAGRRILSYESALADKIAQLKKALSEIKTLSGLLPLCASCHKIRDDKGYWNQLEKYIREHSDADLTHSLCPECVERLYPRKLATKASE